MCNILIWGMRVIQNFNFFAIAHYHFFSYLFPFLFLGVFNYGQVLKMGPCSILGEMENFGPVLRQTDSVAFQFTTSDCRRYPKPTVKRIDHPHQEYMMTFKSMTSHKRYKKHDN